MTDTTAIPLGIPNLNIKEQAQLRLRLAGVKEFDANTKSYKAIFVENIKKIRWNVNTELISHIHNIIFSFSLSYRLDKIDDSILGDVLFTLNFQNTHVDIQKFRQLYEQEHYTTIRETIFFVYRRLLNVFEIEYAIGRSDSHLLNLLNISLYYLLDEQITEHIRLRQRQALYQKCENAKKFVDDLKKIISGNRSEKNYQYTKWTAIRLFNDLEQYLKKSKDGLFSIAPNDFTDSPIEVYRKELLPIIDEINTTNTEISKSEIITTCLKRLRLINNVESFIEGKRILMKEQFPKKSGNKGIQNLSPYVMIATLPLPIIWFFDLSHLRPELFCDFDEFKVFSDYKYPNERINNASCSSARLALEKLIRNK